MNDKLEKNIDQASIQIDMLDMLFKRMTGNLSEEEDQYLSHIIRELKMNFVEEKNNPEKSNDSQSVEKESKVEGDLEPEINNTNGRQDDETTDKTEVKKD